MFHGVFGGWLALALVNATLVQLKNRHSSQHHLGAVAWFFISLLIGPIATLIILVRGD